MDQRRPDDASYVVQFGFTPFTVLVLICCVVFVAAVVQMPIDPTRPMGTQYLVNVVGIPFFGIGGLMLAISAARGSVALRVDQHGITLGAHRIPKLGMSSRPLRVAWQHVAAIVLFQLYARPGPQFARSPRSQWIGVQLRPDARDVPTTFNTNSRLWEMNRAMGDHVPEGVLMRSRPVLMSELDEQRLADAVATYAPDVRIVRLERFT